MRWILLILAGLAGLVVLLAVVGALLPRNHRVTSWVEVPAPPAEVWTVVRDLGQVPSYWSDIRSSVREADPEGRERWNQTLKDGMVLPLVVEEEVPPTRLVTRIAPAGKMPFGGTWKYEITEAPGGSRVTVTEDGWVSNVFFRVVSRIMGHHTTIDRYLRALAGKFGVRAEPAHS